MKLGLGTVQFGLAYGVANRVGRPGRGEVRAILEQAARSGVRVLDTAPAYGDAETLLGELASSPSAFDVVTKTPAALRSVRPGALTEALEASLRRLGRDAVHGVLVHDARDLLGDAGPRLFDELERARSRGLARRIGVSVYDPATAVELAGKFALDLVQLPLSVLDQRAVSSGALDRLAERGVEVHARSVFLQGLLLMDSRSIPEPLASARPAVERVAARAAQLGRTPLELALGFAASFVGVRTVLCGVDSAAQLVQLAAAARTELDPRTLSDVAIHDIAILEPSRWPALRKS
jgi:aryl-alcohol dehydrogenase-like predicted oxidoreductase